MIEEIRAVGVAKCFGKVWALAGVDLVCRAGTVTTIEGANGSGKSTLLAILGQWLQPTRGAVQHTPTPRDAHQLARHTGMLRHASLLYAELSGRENLSLYAQLYEVPQSRQRVEQSLQRFGLSAVADRPVATYSCGQQQRTALARALLHRPPLLLLDEPSRGLDAQGLQLLNDVLAEERQRGSILVLITHDDTLAARFADQRILLHQGRLAGGSL